MLTARHASVCRIGVLSAFMVAGVVAVGCAGKRAPENTSAAARSDKGSAAPASAPSDLELSPMTRASENGLEVAWWIVTSSDEEIGRALASYLPAPLPVDPNVAALWEANGLRLVTIPLNELEAVQSRLSMAGAIQRQWLGQTPTWTDTITGPAWTRSRIIILDAGRLTLGPGRMRVLTRCWTVPVPVAATERDPSPAAALHIELLLQHKESERAEHATVRTEMPGASDALEAGLVFRRLLAEMTVTQGDAYLVVPYKPGTPWGGEKSVPGDAVDVPAPESPARTTEAIPKLGEVHRGESASVPDEQNAAKSDQPVGPPEVPAITIGEALLTNDGVRQPTTFNPDPGTRAVWRADRPARAMLILIPRVPDRFRLIDTSVR